MHIVIVGGGVAGLNAARLLAREGVSFELLEARDRFGGRALTADERGVPATDGYDLGPSWYWPDAQPAIAELVAELGLTSFAQASEGHVIFERMSREPARRYSSVDPAPASMRLVGGVASLVRALAAEVASDRCRLDTTVTGLTLHDERVQVTYRDQHGRARSSIADRVILAVPPRVLQATVTFDPPLPPKTAELWRATPTWMANQAKFFALYDTPFWRTDGLSGTAQSMVGPMPEIHDATTASGAAALLGFVGIGASQRAELGDDAVTAACMAQLVRLFGPAAAAPTATLLHDWAIDEHTATADDLASSGHPQPSEEWVSGAWRERILLAASETAPSEAGYLAGAVAASRDAAADATAGRQ